MSKRYHQAAALVDRKATYSLDQAVTILQQFPPVKFDETVELSASLNIDPKKSDQVVRGTVNLPHGTGKTRKVLVFCKGEKEIQAREAGADYVGGAELMSKVLEGWLDFGVVIATPEMMRDVSRLGKILGPRGLMPTPKTGTVTPDVKKAIKEIKGGRVEFKSDKTGGLHVLCGKSSFPENALLDNTKTVIKAVIEAKPPQAKGDYIKRVTLSVSQGPGIKLRATTMSVAEE